MQIGYIGLGKMGLAMVARLLEKKHRVVVWNRSDAPRAAARRRGAEIALTLKELCEKLSRPRVVWIMVPYGVVDGILRELTPHLLAGDTVIDGGNSFFKDSMRRAKELARRGIHFLDVGVSGGPSGARNGACLMVGGEKKMFERNQRLFQDLSGAAKHSHILKNMRMLHDERQNCSYAYVGKSGAGHFVKMVHNGIEYGMMQALGEGFEVMKKSKFRFNLKTVAELYNHGSVIESRLTGWLVKAFAEHGGNLKDISGEVAQSGEGLWTVETAKELGVSVKVIKDSLDFRIKSKGNPSFAGQVVSTLRGQFGGHEVSAKRKVKNAK